MSVDLRKSVAVVGVGCTEFGELYGLAHNLGGPAAVSCVSILTNQG